MARRTPADEPSPGPDVSKRRSVMNWLCRSPGRAFLIIFVLAFAVRLALLLSWMTPHRWIVPESNSEVGAVAQSLYLTGRYADGYAVPSGPTAHPLPIYTGLLSLIYGLFGLTWTAGYVRSVLHIASFSAMYAMMPWVGGRLGVGRPAGVIAGVGGAVFPQFGLGEMLGWSGSEVHAAILLAVLLAACVRRWMSAAPTAGGALVIGLGFGVAFHCAPALLTVMLGCMGFQLWWSRDSRKWRQSLMMVSGAALACVPWTWRNYAAFHELFFIRSNFGLELRVANHEGAAADMDVMDAREGNAMRHPGNNAGEARQVRELGEMEYMRRARREALEWITAHPAEFARLTALRVIHFWFGPLHRPVAVACISLLTVLAALGMWHVLPRLAAPQRAALLIPLATFPLVYYVVTYMFRYRIAVHWILLLLAGAEVWHWFGRRESAGRM